MCPRAHSRPTPATRVAWALLAVLAAALTPGVTVRAQTRDTMPMSASLLRRLAEAADAQRTGRRIWLVADPRFPHDVDTVLVSPPPADLVMPPGYRVYGPYLTPRDFGLPVARVFGCVHTTFPIPSAFDPRRHLDARLRPSTGMCPMRAIPIDSIARMELIVVTLADTLRIPLPPQTVDAVFFSVSAFDKFVAPYYAKVQGPAYAQALRDSVEAVVRR